MARELNNGRILHNVTPARSHTHKHTHTYSQGYRNVTYIYWPLNISTPQLYISMPHKYVLYKYSKCLTVNEQRGGSIRSFHTTDM
jgi:hypothetical protein